MTHYRKRTIAFAVCLSFLAGYVDAFGFLSMGGFFVSFMSGNSTRLGVGLGTGHFLQAAKAFGLICVFVLGVALASLAGKRVGNKRRQAILALVTAALTLASVTAISRAPLTPPLLALAMGMLNGVFERDGEVTIGLTYMTGALVKMGQRLAGAVSGGSKTEWLPFAALWLGLALGASCGAGFFASYGVSLIWVSAVYAALMTAISPRVP